MASAAREPIVCMWCLSKCQMFEQTFVDGVQKTKKPVTILFSVVVQISALFILILIPLVYTAALPSVQIRNLFIAPRPPHIIVPDKSVRLIETKSAAKPFDPHRLVAPVVIPKSVTTFDSAPPPEIGVVGSISEPAPINGAPDITALTAVPAPAVPAPQPKRTAPNGPIRVGRISEANLIHKVVPVYPPLAKSARIQGSVEFTAMISKQGEIENLQLVHGHPLLVTAAREAVLQWRYRPTLLNGQPVEVITDIIVNFTLSQ